MSEEIFDFGFTLVDEDELDTVQEIEQKVSESSTTTEQTQDKLDKLFSAIQPLLNNLKANPEKELIKWPNRLEKIEAFEDHIQKIYIINNIIINGVNTNNVKVTLPTKKDGVNIQTYDTTMGELMNWYDFYGVLRDYYVNENNKMNPDALTDSVLSGIKPYNASYLGSNLLHYNSSIGLFGTRRHILVIPNWKEDEQTALYDAENTTDNYDFNNPNHHIAPNPHLIGCFRPCIKKKIGGFHSITVALPSEYIHY